MADWEADSPELRRNLNRQHRDALPIATFYPTAAKAERRVCMGVAQSYARRVEADGNVVSTDV